MRKLLCIFLIMVAGFTGVVASTRSSAQSGEDKTWTTEFPVEKGELVSVGRNPYMILELYPNVILFMVVGIAAIFYTAYLLYAGIPIFMGISDEEGFVYASSVLTVGLVMLVALMAITVLVWSFGFGPEYVW
jgi:hypothetical protein